MNTFAKSVSSKNGLLQNRSLRIKSLRKWVTSYMSHFENGSLRKWLTSKMSHFQIKYKNCGPGFASRIRKFRRKFKKKFTNNKLYIYKKLYIKNYPFLLRKFVTSKMGHFANWSLRKLVTSKMGHSANYYFAKLVNSQSITVNT